eukprot:TRINITY_DN40801_c0_g1_i2.p1 TRINITY_DN40801_c0_g1~~TRINITY_DN40801_c0_g1_i2.p1  ORF type:complete len:568 (+),score=90.77 TRINITY_DN40801_c0_g1_i2:426-2129(+)
MRLSEDLDSWMHPFALHAGIGFRSCLRATMHDADGHNEVAYHACGRNDVYFTQIAFLVAVSEQFRRTLVELRKAIHTPWGEQRQEMLRRFHTIAWLEFLAAALNLTFVLGLTFFAARGDTQYFDQVGISYYINTFALIILSGACRRMPEQEALAAEAEVERQRRRGEAALSYAACEDRIWQSQVEEMAHRAFTLQELLNFYSRLPVLMPHFDPQKHTTTDVVSGAIIPDSADLKSAYATRMMAGRCLRPNVMVTHNWGNLFRDLCAVMVAHALREPDFGLISHLLDSFDLKSVNELLTEDALAMTFWVCAFSVNQHRSICGRNPHKTTDTVTRNLHPLCPCGEKVYLNDTPPVRGDGKSVRCEMNKFDDMLAYLAASDPGFHHVIAVDRRFVLFSRAWCVAELAVGHQLGVKQQIIVFSPCSIVEHRSQLDGLRIQDMEASRPEDVSEILSKIPDADAFNQHLQQMLLGDRGLLVLWTSMDEFTMVARLGQVAHMAKTLRKALEDPLSRQCSWIRCASKGELGELGDEPLPTLLRIDPIQDKGATATFAASATKDCAVVGEDYKLSL